MAQPDRPSGRGLHPIPSPVKRLAVAHGVPVFQPPALKHASDIDRVRSLQPDALVVAAYGLLLPPALLEAGRYGALNVHASLLPRWRGAAPVQRAILAGDAATGVSIMQMDAGLDTGPVLRQVAIAITDDDDAGTLGGRLADLGAGLMADVLADLAAGRAHAQAQPDAGATYARKVDKREARLDWTRPARELARAVRAFRPAPGAVAALDGEPLKIWRARVVERSMAPGELAPDFTVGCGEHALQILELQRAGGKRLPAADFLRGYPLRPGARLT